MGLKSADMISLSYIMEVLSKCTCVFNGLCPYFHEFTTPISDLKVVLMIPFGDRMDEMDMPTKCVLRYTLRYRPVANCNNCRSLWGAALKGWRPGWDVIINPIILLSFGPSVAEFPGAHLKKYLQISLATISKYDVKCSTSPQLEATVVRCTVKSYSASYDDVAGPLIKTQITKTLKSSRTSYK